MNMPQFKVVRVYVVDGADEADAQYMLKQWLTSLQCREMYDVRLVWEAVKPADEPEHGVKAMVREARNQVLGPKPAA